MSNAFAIAAVTAVLKHLMDMRLGDSALTSALGGAITATAVAPDLIKTDPTPSAPQLNLFLYHVEPNPGWRNRDLPSHDPAGDRVSNPMLALDLYYLVTAYGLNAPYQAEILLGYAAQLLHEMPVLTRNTIREAFKKLAGTAPTGVFAEMRDSRLADQIEQIKIAPHVLNLEETSKLWSALQSHYRPSLAYHLSVVLIESEKAARSVLPVLQRSITVTPSLGLPFPTLTDVIPPNSQPSVHIGETLTLEGHDLSGTTVEVYIGQPHREASHVVTPATATAANVTFVVPDIPAGHYTVAVETTTGSRTRRTNALPFALAPKFDQKSSTEINAAVSAGPNNSLEVEVKNISPNVGAAQQASLIIGDRESVRQPLEAAAADVTFIFVEAVKPPPGTYPVRLRVDGVESLLVLRDPPSFDPSQSIVIPP